MSERLLPLFPLGTVLIPGQVLPLHVFEPRYRELVATLVDGPDDHELGRGFGVVAIREGHEVGADSVRSLHEVGTFARLQTVERYDDGRFDIVTVGTRRFRVDGFDTTASYLRGSVTWLPEGEGDTAAVLAPTARALFVEYRDRLAATGLLAPIDPDTLTHDPSELSYLIASAMVLDRADRQQLLERADHSARLHAEVTVLRRETALALHLPSIPAGDLARTGISLN